MIDHNFAHLEFSKLNTVYVHPVFVYKYMLCTPCVCVQVQYMLCTPCVCVQVHVMYTLCLCTGTCYVHPVFVYRYMLCKLFSCTGTYYVHCVCVQVRVCAAPQPDHPQRWGDVGRLWGRHQEAHRSVRSINHFQTLEINAWQ